ncbi:hypothetical protein GCM10020369_58370 [Cryptosporangium minutisporangium]|uniref:HTH cro/C1-type domain-containing protein n=1 Tax=Cryptosporangium minutisporangium TaxID=113569 RepID=A0ABP6T5Z9_9ACTN
MVSRQRAQFGADLVRMRKAAGFLTQASWANALNRYSGAQSLTRNEVSRWERGIRVPDGWLSAIAATLDVSLEDLERRASAARSSHPIAASHSAPIEDADPRLIQHWDALLRMLSDHENLLGASAVYEVAQGEFGLVREHRGRSSGTAVTELLRVEARWAEFCSWTAENAGARPAAVQWLDRALTLAERADARPTAAYVRMRQAQHAADHGEAERALALAERAADAPELSRRDRALCAIRQAQGHALRHDQKRCSAAFAHAHRLVDQAAEVDVDDPNTIGAHASRQYLAAYESYCLLLLGDLQQAIHGFEAALADWPANYRQDEALTRAWLGQAYLAAGRCDEAAAQGTRALTLTGYGPSARATRAIRKLYARLEPSDSSTSIEFRAAYAQAPSMP